MTDKLGPGIYFDVPHDSYHADPVVTPSLSASLASILLEDTPKHAWQAHPRLGGGSTIEDADDTEASDRGTILHSLLLGVGSDFDEIDAKDFRTNAAKAARDAARALGKVPVIASKMARYRATAAVLKTELARVGVEFTGGHPEVTMVWESEGVLCRCRIDYLHLSDASALITDLKTSDSANPDKAGAKLCSNGRDIAVAAYIEAIETLRPDLAGRVTKRFAYAEPTRPYCVSVVEPDGEMRELGRRRWARAKKRWRQCLERGEWPGWTTAPVQVGPPPWAIDQDMQQQLSAMQASNGKAPF